MFRKTVSLLIIITFVSMLIISPYGFALPEGENVVNGQASFQEYLNGLNINVATEKAIIEWLNFCIAHGETVNFFQPSSSSITLNRVVGLDPSTIFGALTATGKIFLINPNGILFGASSRVDTAGLTASTLNISNEDFLAGRYSFYGQGGSVVNQGYISAPGGYVALLGSSVENSGVIEASLGTVALAAGEAITLNMDPLGLISVVVDQAVSKNIDGKEDAVKNAGTISADGGKVILTAEALNGVFNRAVNNTGIIEAGSLVNKQGEVYLVSGGEDSLISNSGTIDVSAKESGADGGFVELSGGELDFANGIINASPLDGGKSGSILFDPYNIIIGNAQAAALEALNANVTLTATNNILFNILDDNALNLVNFDTETFTLKAGNLIGMGNDSIITNGGGIQLLALGDINLGTGAGLQSNGGQITLNGANLHLSALVDAGAGDVTMTASNGAIIDENGNDPNVIAKNLDLSATTGIGSADALETAISNLTATNGSNDIGIDNTGNLAANSLINNGGNITLNNDSDLTLGTIQALGNTVTLTSAGAILDGNGGANNISADSLFLTASNGIGSAGTLETTVSNLTATNNGSNDIAIDNTGALAANSVVNNGGNITLTNDLDLTLGTIQALGNTVALKSAAGAITDGNGGALNVIANSLGLSATTGIGSGNALETQVGTLSALNKTSGNIRIDNTGNLAANSVVNNGGNITLNNDSDLILGTIQALGNTVTLTSAGAILDGNGAANNISANSLFLTASNGIGSADALETAVSSLTATNGSNDIGIDNTGNLAANSLINNGGNITLNNDSDLTLGTIQALGNTVTLTSAGAILDGNGAANNISANSLFLTASNGIGSADALETAISNLTATNGSNDIGIDNTGNLAANSLINNGGNITLNNDSDLTLGTIQALGNTVTLTSAGAILDGNGGANNISADSLFLTASNGIGSADALETQVSTLDALNTTSGNIEIDNTGVLYAQSVINQSGLGDIVITANSDLTVGNIQAFGLGNVYLTTTGGSILDDLAFDPADTNFIIGNLVQLNASGNIGNSGLVNGDIDVSTNTINAQAAGDLVIEEADSALFNTITAGGLISLLAHGTSSLVNIIGNGSVNIRTSSGDLNILGTVTSNLSGVGLTADNGSIYAFGSGPHLVANGDSFINAPNGAITPFGSPLNVYVAGDLFLNIANLAITFPTRLVYGNLTGTIISANGIPLIFPLSFPSSLNPPGFVYFNGIQIWPPTSNAMFQQLAQSTARSFEHGYFEFLQSYRMISFDQTAPNFYAYHPLAPIDSSAFDALSLDTGFYEFLNDNINLKKTLGPYFGEEEAKKKE